MALLAAILGMVIIFSIGLIFFVAMPIFDLIYNFLDNWQIYDADTRSYKAFADEPWWQDNKVIIVQSVIVSTFLMIGIVMFWIFGSSGKVEYGRY
jgi:hypothetical protein